MAEFTAVLDFMSHDPSIPTRFVAHFAQSFASGGSFSSVPTLATYNVRGENSAVFTFAKKLDVEKPRQAFERGEASPRDLDRHGQFLLHVSSIYPSKFSGLPTNNSHIYHIYHLQQVALRAIGRNSSIMADIVNAVQFLLEHGVDTNLTS
jgi:hypothetical protein